jgi:hypothetical protein
MPVVRKSPDLPVVGATEQVEIAVVVVIEQGRRHLEAELGRAEADERIVGGELGQPVARQPEIRPGRVADIEVQIALAGRRSAAVGIRQILDQRIDGGVRRVGVEGDDEGRSVEPSGEAADQDAAKAHRVADDADETGPEALIVDGELIFGQPARGAVAGQGYRRAVQVAVGVRENDRRVDDLLDGVDHRPAVGCAGSETA